MSDSTQGGQVQFLPNRLNRQPVIIMGLTADELWFCVAVFGVLGIVLGILVGFVFRDVAVGFTVIPLVTAAGLFVGGRKLRTLKRGRPETWLYRTIQWQLIHRVPALGQVFGGSDLIRRSGYWSQKRSHS